MHNDKNPARRCAGNDMNEVHAQVIDLACVNVQVCGQPAALGQRLQGNQQRIAGKGGNARIG